MCKYLRFLSLAWIPLIHPPSCWKENVFHYAASVAPLFLWRRRRRPSLGKLAPVGDDSLSSRSPSTVAG